MTTLYPHQRKGVRRLLKFDGRALVADEMGLGKSLMSLAYAKEAGTFPIIIVCPAGLKWNWENEVRSHMGWRSVILSSRRPFNIELGKNRVVIVNYEILDAWLKKLKRLNPSLIIFDESQYLINRKSIRTRRSRQLAKIAPHVIAMSGTPFTQYPMQMWPTLNIVRPDLYGNFTDYAWRYCNPQWTEWGWDFSGASKLDLLHKRLKRTMMIRRRKEDVLKLPKLTNHVVITQLKNEPEYKRAVKDFRTWIIENRPKNYKTVTDNEQRAQLILLKQLVGILKVPYVIEWVQNYLQETDRKLIVFGLHVKVVKAIHEHFSDLSVLVDGSVTGRKRQIRYNAFQERENIRLLVGNMDAAGVGWNGTAANTVVFPELAWSRAKHDQARDRIYRIGQKRQCACYYLIAKNTLEERLMRMHQSKQKAFDTIVDGREVSLGGNVYKMMVEYLMKEAA